jgi:predicted porin
MKKLTSAVILSAIGFHANAQSTVQIYGIMDAAMERLNKTATGDGVTRMTSLSGRAGSRLGFRGEEVIGPNLRAVFTLEMGIAPNTGNFNQGGRPFGRQAWTGLKTDLGTVTFGRQYSMLLSAFGNSDVTSGGGHGLGALDSYLSAARVDNSVAYRSKVGNLEFGATYSFGRDELTSAANHCAGSNPNSSSECTQWSAMAKYDKSGWGVGFGVDEYRGGPKAAAGLVNASMKDRRVLLSGYKNFGSTRVGGGLIARKDDALGAAAKTNLWYVGASHKLNNSLSFDAQAALIDNTSNANGATLLVARATHAFSKRTSVYTSVSYVRNKGQANYSASSARAGGLPAAGQNQAAYAVGLYHSF